MNDLEFETARIKSQALLVDWLTPKQKKEFDATYSFYVKGVHTGRTYLINQGYSYNVTLFKKGQPVGEMCFGPYSEGFLHYFDIMLAQKIALESNEKYVLSIANLNHSARRAFHKPDTFEKIALGLIVLMVIGSSAFLALAGLIGYDYVFK